MHAILFALVVFASSAFRTVAAADDGHAAHPLAESATLSVAAVVQAASARDGINQILESRLAEADAMTRNADLILAGAPALSLRYNGDAPGEDRGLTEFESQVNLPLKWPGQRAAQQRVAAVAGELARAGGTASLWRIAGVVRDLVWEHHAAAASVEAARDALELARAIEDSVGHRVALGDLARSDGLLAESERLARARERAEAEVRLLDAERRYIALTGLREIPTARPEPRATFNNVENHPLLRAVDRRLEQARENVDLNAYAGRTQPSVALGPRWERGASGDSYADSLGVIVNLPFGQAPYVALGVASAERIVTETLIERRRLRRQLDLAVHEAAHDLAAIGKRIENVTAWRQLASERETIAQIAFDAGETALVEYLRVRQDSIAAVRTAKLVDIQYSHAMARFNQASGSIPGVATEIPPR